jgi:hypothetical protein
MINFLFPIAHGVTISTSIPGMSSGSSAASPGAWIAGFYQFALLIGGILAFGAIVFGGVKYTASAGNPSSQSDAKEWIEGALIGLLLLAGVYLILYVINPNLVNLSMPGLTTVTVQSQNYAPSNQTPNVACGSEDANGDSQVGQCQNSSNGSVNYCCSDTDEDGDLTYACQSTPCQ